MKKIIIACLYLFYTQLSWASGGTVVGNGAGLVESNFQNAYNSLTKIIPNCLAISKCNLQADEKILAEKILKIALHNSNKKDRLIFVSGKANPGFFTTGTAEANRIAKTFLTPNSPIYVNSDMLYTSEGKPAQNFQSIVTILIHEIGHQTGNLNHAALDILGVKISAFSEGNTSYYRYEDISFSVTNFEFPVKTAVLIFNWKNLSMQNLSDSVFVSSACQYDSESFDGLLVLNGHYSFKPNGALTFDAWVNVSCYESFSTEINVYRRNLQIDLDQNYQIMNLIIN